MKKLHVACSPITKTIFCGTVLKDGRTWGANKQDVTIEAMFAVAERVDSKFEGEVMLTYSNDMPAYKITVERL